MAIRRTDKHRFEFPGLLWLVRDTRQARTASPEAIARRQRRRLAGLVAFAREHSAYYRERYRDLPEHVDDPTLLPVTSKPELMARFDDWVTDPAVTLEQAQAFVDDPSLIGQRFLDRYILMTTSGTTGTRGLFLLDQPSLRVTNVLMLRALSDWLDAGDVVRILLKGARLAMVNATGGHFASAVAAARLRKNRLRRRLIRVFSVQTPIPELVAARNRFQPALVAPYASMAAILASEQEAGRLHIDPVLLVLSAEGLPETEYGRIARAFGAKVRFSYAASECPFLSYSCQENWLHVDSDWVILEPVDADYQPVPPGEPSHTVLISNLANRVQPILRYDLGDSVTLRPDPCPCGNPLPAIRVEGRAADVLTFPTPSGERIRLAPLVIATVVDRLPGIALFQVVQTAPETLRVRLRSAAGADPERVWQDVRAALTDVLREHLLEHVAIERGQEPPEQSAGGKYRRIIPA